MAAPYKPEFVSGNIVALGAFNPAIFSPDWLEKNGLIGPDDAAQIREGKNCFVSRQLTQLEAENFKLVAEENKLQVNSKGALTPALRDFVMGIFELLPHTPLIAIGLNFDTQFRFFDVAAFHRVGDTLAPKNVWGKVFAADKFIAGLESITIKIQEGTREKLESNNCRNITLRRVVADYPAINLSYNDHYDLTEIETKERSQTEEAVGILKSQWEATWQEAIPAFSRIIDLALEGA